jgi:hypothetical protein
LLIAKYLLSPLDVTCQLAVHMVFIVDIST